MMWLARRILIIGLVASASGCSPPDSKDNVQPLRPLLYTEPAENISNTIDGFEDWVQPSYDPVAYPGSYQTTSGHTLENEKKYAGNLSTPTQTIRRAIDAVRSNKSSHIDTLVPNKDSLVHVLHFSETKAQNLTHAITKSLHSLQRRISPAQDPAFRRTDWDDLLQVTQITLGKPRKIDGSIVSPTDAVMYDSNRVSIHLVGSDVDFHIYFPRVFRTNKGWALGGPPSVSNRYELLLRLGFDQKSELLRGTQSGFPFRKGNYWDYRIERKHKGTWKEVRGRGFRDIVEDIEDYDLYRVITIRRTFQSPKKSDKHYQYLQTPSRIFTCDRSCQRATGSLQRLLDDLRSHEPLAVFPLNEPHNQDKENRGSTPAIKLEEQYQVPMGTFGDVHKLHQNGTKRNPDIYIRSGTGILAYEWLEAGQTYRAALHSMRILR